MEQAASYIPLDRRLALASGENLSEHSTGAVLFADISGFTPLTEALVRDLGPKRGAEELTYQLNLVYDALIDEVHRYRGSVIGFSGDAITCWLADDDGRRAATCSLMLQQTMQQFANITLPSGDVVTLAMKAAVATGAVRRFVVGDPSIQRIDVLAGTTLERMAAAEQMANKGEVVLSPEVAAHLETGLHIAEWRTASEQAAGERFAVITGLNKPAPADPWPEVTNLPEDQVRSWLLPPVYERVTYGQGQFLAEVRPAVALFLRFSGIDYDNDVAAGTMLDTYIRWVQRILNRYESSLLQVTIGDKGSYLYAAFGAPLAHDDDPARAVAAAMELHSPPPELAYIHNVQIGITSGKMRTGAYGGSARRTYGVLGDSVNLAARLMSKAEPGQTLVSKSIALAVSDNYHLRSLGHMQVKGKRDPIDVSLVVGPRRLATQAVFANYFNPLLGRENELAWMDQYAQMAREGSGQIIRLEASAGMGKSHLASVFSTQAAERGMHIARGACQIVSQGQAYAPWQQILQALLETAAASADESQAEELAASDVSRLTALLTNMNPDWLLRLPLLSDVLVIDIPDNATTAAFDARQRQDALFSLMVDIVAYQARRQPLLIVMEDIHWIDESSRGLIVALSRVLNHLPLLLLLVQRPKLDDGQPLLPELNALAYHRHLLLKELSPEGVRGLVVACLQGQPSPLALSLIQSQSQGNPFFVEELIDALTETEKLYEQEDGTWTLSDQVFHALRQAHCLTRYEQNGEWVLASDAQLSAVALGIPDSVHSAVLSRMDRLPESHKLTLKVSSVIGRLFAFSVLSQAHPDQFDIPLLLEQFQAIGERDFVQVEIPLPHLMYMFKHHITQEVAYGTLLDAQQRMLHGRVGEVLEQVSPYAVEQLAYHFSRSDDQAKALLYLDAAARKLQREYANETALYYYQQALEREERWEWRRGQVEILHTLGRREEEQAALYALEAAPEVPAFEVARLWAHYHEATGSYAEALEAIERALAINADAPECYLLGTSCYYLQGNLDTALEWVRRGLAIAERLESVHDQAQALKWVGIILDDQGNLAQGLEAQEQSAELLEQISHLPGLITALNSLGILYHNAGRWEEAIDSFTYSIQLSESIGDALGSARASMNLGLLYSDRGDPARANELYIYSAEQFQRIGSELGLGLVTANRGELMLVQGNPQEAIRLLLESVEILERINARIDLPELLWTAAEAALELGDPAQATQHAEHALAIALELGVELSTAVVRRVLAQIALHQHNIPTATAYMEQSLASLRQLGHRYELGRALYWQARILHAAGELEQARATLQEARQVFEELHAQRDLALVQTFEQEIGQQHAP